jgi:hypothetical protein
MTTPEIDLDSLPWWGGVYKIDRSVRDAPGGFDDTVAVVSGRVRASARAAGHEPRGGVTVQWSEYDPDDVPPGDPPPADPDKVWAIVQVRVVPGP